MDLVKNRPSVWLMVDEEMGLRGGRTKKNNKEEDARRRKEGRNL
jgi:hypothetical protein